MLAYVLTDVVSSSISTRVTNWSSSRCSPGMCGRPVTHMGLALDVVSASIVWKRWINRLTLIPISGIIHTGKRRDLGSRWGIGTHFTSYKTASSEPSTSLRAKIERQNWITHWLVTIYEYKVDLAETGWSMWISWFCIDGKIAIVVSGQRVIERPMTVYRKAEIDQNKTG